MVQDDDSYQLKHVARTATATNTVSSMIVTAGPFYSYHLFFDDFNP